MNTIQAMLPQTPPSNNNLAFKHISYSPVSIPQSPAAVSPQKNLTGLPRVARDIAADIYNNIQKWNENHIQGSNIVKQIALTKSDSIKKYPSSLEGLMTDLFDIVQKLAIYSNALFFLSSQMKALVKLQKDSKPLFISLSIEKISELVDSIAEAYKVEFKEKQYILENIAHSQSKNEVMYFASSWTHQCHINANINLQLETVLTETGHRRLT